MYRYNHYTPLWSIKSTILQSKIKYSIRKEPHFIAELLVVGCELGRTLSHTDTLSAGKILPTGREVGLIDPFPLLRAVLMGDHILCHFQSLA